MRNHGIWNALAIVLFVFVFSGYGAREEVKVLLLLNKKAAPEECAVLIIPASVISHPLGIGTSTSLEKLADEKNEG
jgi:hypothetical protein